MSFIASIASSKAIVSVLAVGAGSVLGYNWVTTGCPSGVCPTERAASSAVIPASLEAGEYECSASTCDDMVAKTDCCPLMAETQQVALEGTADCAVECTDMAACDGAKECTDEAVNVQNASMTTEEKTDSCCPLSEAVEQTASNAP